MRTLAIALLLTASFGTQASELQQLSAEGEALIPPFQQQLLSTVKSAMQNGGPSKAVESCQLLAPEITAQHSQTPWKVSRTSMKVRNQANAPDEWERKVLEQFAERSAKGEALAEMKHAEIVNGEFRMMKAIPTGEPCLTCHGQNIKPELATVIDQRYPQDQARGFALGELRGAFSLRRAVGEESSSTR